MPRSETLAAPAAPRRWPVRLIMVAIVFALIVPGIVFGIVLLDQIAGSERARAQQIAQAAASRAAEALDRELGNLAASLLALTTSPSLDSGDLAAFYRQASTVGAQLNAGIVLGDLEAQQILNTRRPFGEPLPRMQATAAHRQAIDTKAVAVSQLCRGAVTGSLSVVVDQPVIRNDRVTAVLALSLRPLSLSSLLLKQGLPQGWRAALVDGDERIIGRTEDAENFIGRPVIADITTHGAGNNDMWVGTAIDGVTPQLFTMQRLRIAAWRVVIVAPLDVVEAPLRHTLTLLGITGLVTLGVACLLAWQLADSIAVPLQRLSQAGRALGQGLPVERVRSPIAEVDAVSAALVRATQDLNARAEALAAERAQLAAIIETVPVGIVITELPSGRVVAGNRQLDAMLRHELLRSDDAAHYGEWVAHHADGRLVQPGDYPLAKVAAGADHAELVCLYQRGDGTPLWIQIVGAPIRGPDGAITGGVAALLDIDEVVRAREAKDRFAESLEAQVAERTAALEAEARARTAAEEQLRQAQKMEAVGQLTGGIAHDFNNLLTIIIGSLDLLRRRAVDPRTSRLLDNALEGATRAATLTARLLAFSRRQPLSPQTLDLNELVEGMSDLLHRTLGEAITIETTLAPSVWPTMADPNQLENALLNLAVNARDAIIAANRPGGRLTIETTNATLESADLVHDPDVQPGPYIRVAVTDTGTGMPPEIVARVFEPFYTTKPLGQGTGLGLSQVHGFVKQSGGHVAIQTTPSEGTTVALYLPRAEIPGDISAAPGPGDDALNLPSLLVLVVEDDGGVRRYSVEALHDLGHRVLEADTAENALQIMAEHPEIGLLLTDLALPTMNGVQLADEARRRHPDLPILFASGYNGAESSRLPQGAPFLQKPFTVQALAEKLHDLLATDAPGRTRTCDQAVMSGPL